MYKIVGADQRTYGPVPKETVLQWLAEGRVNGPTLVQTEGSMDWRPLSALWEFAGAVAPPPLPGVPPPFSSIGQPLLKNSGMAVAGFVCSLLGLMCCGPLFSTLGLAFSIIGVVEVNRNPRQLTGKNLAIAGIIIATVGLLLFFATFVIGFWPGLLKGMRFHRQWHI